MKDATGELSMTAVAVVAIAAIATVFTTLVWPTIKTNILRSTYCSQAVSCDYDGETDGMIECKDCKGDDDTECENTVMCKASGDYENSGTGGE